MPYATRKRGDKLVNINIDTGAVKGTFPDTPAGKARAQLQLNLLRGIEHEGWKPTGAPARKNGK